jgi:hypothetical protein
MKVLICGLIIFLAGCGSSVNNNMTTTVVPQNNNVKIDDFTVYGRGFVRLYDKETNIVCYSYVSGSTVLKCLSVNE